MHKLFTENAGGINIIVASRYEPSAVYNIKKISVEMSRKNITLKSLHPKQLDLFA